MVDADERLTALKKAYADIILNTAKEAAARIIQSERKALKLQHELNASKEQALQVVLRLKRMMDSKVTEASEMAYLSQHKRIGELEGRLRDAENKIGEAEATSLTQQRKAELLEAQLQEAEDIVHDLRTELSEVQDELERVRNEKSRDITECGTGTQVQASEERSHSSPPQTISSLTTPVVNNSSLQQINEAYNCNEGNDNFPESCSVGKPDILSVSEENTPNYVSPPELLNVSAMKHPALNQITHIHSLHGENSLANRPMIPSVVLRTKEAEPYRNRRTQRIRAFEEKLMAGELSFSDTVATTYVTTGREGEGIHIATLQKSGNMCSTDEKDEGEAENPKETVNKANHVLVKQRKRKNKLRNLSNVLERDQTSSIMSAEGNFINRNGGNPSKTLPKVSDETEDQREIVKIRKTRETDEVSRSKQLSATRENGHEESSDIVPNKRNIEKKESKGSRSNKMKYGKSFRQKWRKCKKTSRILLVETDQTPDTTSTETNPEENQSILLRCTKCTVNDAVVVQGCSSLNNTNSDQASVNKSVPINLEKKASDDMVFFKHTFQRKRKRNTLICSNSNVSLETSILEGKTAEEQNDTVGMKNPTSATEPSPHSGRVAEVARQLISLSDKKW